MQQYLAIGIGLAIGLGALGAGIAHGMGNYAAYTAVGRNPEAELKIRTLFIIGLAASETVVVFALVISFLLYSKL
jgi:F-type H+-transporting ATPase subunit c